MTCHCCLAQALRSPHVRLLPSKLPPAVTACSYSQENTKELSIDNKNIHSIEQNQVCIYNIILINYHINYFDMLTNSDAELFFIVELACRAKNAGEVNLIPVFLLP